MVFPLIETQRRRSISPVGTAVSAVIHSAAIAGAVILTWNQGLATAPPPDNVEKIHFLPTPVYTAPPASTAPRTIASASPLPAFDPIVAPMTIPDILPNIDLTAMATSVDNSLVRHRGPASVSGAPGGTRGAVDGGATYTGAQVEKPAVQVPGVGVPEYPASLKSAYIEGEVLVSFVIDTTGRVDTKTFKIVRSSHERFSAAVRSALPAMRFRPAEVGGQRVKQLVLLPFVFQLGK